MLRLLRKLSCEQSYSSLSTFEVTAAVTVDRNPTVSVLEVAIQSTLRTPFNSVRLKLYRTPDETLM
ncbi:hypothetical protein RhiirA5_508277 [Rhizophagus irregularis]|uniref:Uncharacterized protein n=1 Tax=Rhizophagus irregularis TaxID=588596 RepID=A0A2N0NCY6_9GLOM|nr:hypothetical protein RhiirA5_508277 [Rhizophagus irregularis]